MEKLVEELLKKVTEVKKTPEIYEILMELDSIDLRSNEEIQNFIDDYSNLEEK